MTPALVLSKNIFYRNRESEHIFNLEDCVRIIISWSGLRDLNPRSLEPKSSAIPNFAKPGYSVKDFLDVVKHVVKEILAHIFRTFHGDNCGVIRP